MEVEVYADLLFLINAGMDGICFFLTGRLLHRKLSMRRVMLGAVIGGIYAVAALFFEIGQATALLCDVGVCLTICAIVFVDKKAHIGKYLVFLAVYFMLSMLLGGVMTALFNLLNRVGATDYLPEGDDGPGVWLFALLALVGSGITLWGGRLFRRSAVVRHCRVAIEFEGHHTELEGMVDTGNLLRDPLSGRAVICIERETLSVLLPSELMIFLQNASHIDSLPDTADTRRLRLVPAQTAAGQVLLWGVLPDRVEIIYTHKGRALQVVADVVIAGAELTDTQALVPSELLDSF